MERKEFEHMIPRLRPSMVKVGRNFFGNMMDAEDVAQESLVRLWTYCERLDSDMNIEALAIKVAKNVCMDIYKKMNSADIEPPETLLASSSDMSDAGIMAEYTRQKIDEAIERLNPRECQLIRARHIDDRSTEDISKDTGLPRSSVQSMISVARKKLIKDLQKRLRV